MTASFPFSDKIATGSFDKTCKLWSTETGECYHTFRGHSAEVVSTGGCFLFLYASTHHHGWLWVPWLIWEGAAILLHLFTHSEFVNISALQEKIAWQFFRNKIKHCIEFERIFLFLVCSNFPCWLNVFEKYHKNHNFQFIARIYSLFIYTFFFLDILHCFSYLQNWIHNNIIICITVFHAEICTLCTGPTGAIKEWISEIFSVLTGNMWDAKMSNINKMRTV